MQSTRFVLATLALAALLCAATPLTRPALAAPRPVADGPLERGAGFSRPRTRTLLQHDFTRHSLSLRSGAYGTAVQGSLVVNVDSELDYGALHPAQLTAGVQGSQVGELFDLGATAELAQRYGYEETVGGGQGFASIRFQEGALVILDELATGSVQPFTEGQAFLQARAPAFSTPAAVHVGHVYLVRIVDRLDPAFLRFAKLLVTAHRPGEEVRFMWDELVP